MGFGINVFPSFPDNTKAKMKSRGTRNLGSSMDMPLFNRSQTASNR